MRIEAKELERMLIETPAGPLLPEWAEASRDLAALNASPVGQLSASVLRSEPRAPYAIPLTTYSLYREFRRCGARGGFEAPYFGKRSLLVLAAARVLLSEKPAPGEIAGLQDLIWSVCEESNWVLPAHEWVSVDLFASETAFMLAEIVTLLGDRLSREVADRIRYEADRRVLSQFLDRPGAVYWWWRGENNWNGVCNSSIGATALYLEPDPTRLARIIAKVLEGLDVFIETAFTEDGGSTEGVGYWQYGLLNFVPFAEMLRVRTAGKVDLLAQEKMKLIAAYPLRMLLSPGRVASFSDSHDAAQFHPGLITRLAQRTGAPEVIGLLGGPNSIGTGGNRHLPPLLRDLLWWDGRVPEPPRLADSWLRHTAVCRLTAPSAGGSGVVLMAKAGHNGECHNHNDVGSFVYHAKGETLLVDPGAGLYSRDYFSPRRYENVFANSYGHSVPRIGGALQSPTAKFRGEVLRFEPDRDPKRIEMQIAGAYEAPGLQSALRTFALSSSGALTVEDAFRFAGAPREVEEAFVTWAEVTADGPKAILRGKVASATLTIEEPKGSTFAVERMEDACRANHKTEVLKRLTFVIPAAGNEARARVRASV